MVMWMHEETVAIYLNTHMVKSGMAEVNVLHGRVERWRVARECRDGHRERECGVWPMSVNVMAT